MKNFFRYIVPVLVIIAVFAFMVNRDSEPTQVVREVVTSENGAEELLDFINSLADHQFEHAAQYVQTECETGEPYCMQSDLSNDQIVDYLRGMCETHVCENVELDEAGDGDESRIFTHYLAFLNENGERERLCMDTDCRVQKMTFGFRTVKVDGRWFVVDTPPVRIK